jgi:xanthine dehydrogenase YagR molybdenum-binding subunit
MAGYDIEVIFVDEPDEIINPLGIKGLGEITLDKLQR